MVLHRNQHCVPPRRERSPINASWPAFDERIVARLLDPGLRRTTRVPPMIMPQWPSSKYNRHQQLRSREIQQKLLARVQIHELLKSLRTDRFVGQVHPVAHAIYLSSPERRCIPDQTGANDDTTSVRSSLSSSLESLGRGHREKRDGSRCTTLPLPSSTSCETA